MKLLDWVADKFGYEKKWSPEKVFFGITDVDGKEHFGMVISHGYRFVDCDAFHVQRDGDMFRMSANFRLVNQDPFPSGVGVALESGGVGSTLYLRSSSLVENDDAQ